MSSEGKAVGKSFPLPSLLYIYLGGVGEGVADFKAQFWACAIVGSSRSALTKYTKVTNISRGEGANSYFVLLWGYGRAKDAWIYQIYIKEDLLKEHH